MPGIDLREDRSMTALAKLVRWQKRRPKMRHVHIGLSTVAIAEGGRSCVASGDTAEDAAASVMVKWKEE